MNHAIRRIEQATLQLEPFPYFYIENIFSKESYQELLENLPDPSYYGKCEASSERWSLILDQEHLIRLPFVQQLFWMKFCQTFNDGKLLRAICEKFKIKEKIFSVAQLTLDKKEYSIEPHTDFPGKVATLLFYFPKHKNQSHLGTAIYRPKEPGFTCEGRERHPFDKFEKVWQAPFLPNSVFGFLKTNNSFHGVEPLGKEPIERHVLALTLWRSS